MFDKEFDAFVCDGDAISCTVDGVTYTATAVHDQDSNPSGADGECYSDEEKALWEQDQWHFFGVVLTAEKNGVSLGEVGSLWGIEGNFPSNEENPNTYFREVANELLPEAIDAVEDRIQSVVTALGYSLTKSES